MILGLGTDIVACARLRHLLSTYGARFSKKIFSEAERTYCDAKADPATHYAARFAAKEAARKALTGSPPLSWHDVEVERQEDGPVTLAFYGKAAQVAEALGVEAIHLSISHEQDMAVATVILEGTT
ncbi:MAG: holo-ACP synthase [Myxococcota bacterium]|jgi:holo-[acyl-carrier protein] synthase|nr:holo-ACP synthase [Myxococcota bacterium]